MEKQENERRTSDEIAEDSEKCCEKADTCEYVQEGHQESCCSCERALPMNKWDQGCIDWMLD